MQGKTKSFLEDTVVIVVFTVLAYGAYTLYDIYSNKDKDTGAINQVEIVVEKEDYNITTEKTEESFINNIIRYFQKASNKLAELPIITEIEEIEVIDIIENDDNATLLNNTIKQEPQDNEIIEVQKKTEAIETVEKIIKPIPKQNKKQIEEKSIEQNIEQTETDDEVLDEANEEKVKNVDLAMLRKFMRDLKFKIASNLVKRDDVNATISQELEIRITVLADGNSEQLTFVSGDEVLFEMNKENITNVFPVKIDDKIKEDFPRYVRLNIK